MHDGEVVLVQQVFLGPDCPAICSIHAHTLSEHSLAVARMVGRSWAFLQKHSVGQRSPPKKGGCDTVLDVSRTDVRDGAVGLWVLSCRHFLCCSLVAAVLCRLCLEPVVNFGCR